MIATIKLTNVRDSVFKKKWIFKEMSIDLKVYI